MEKVIERIVRNNPQLDGAEVITASVTREDRTKAHYYIFKQVEDLGFDRTRIPIGVLTMENGKGRNKHYVVVAVTEDGYRAYDLNKPRNIKIEGNTAIISGAETIGCNIPEDKIKEPLPF